jgi:ribosomal protein L11 methyltransferase
LFVGAPDELPSIEADVLIANILAGTLIDLAAALAVHVRPLGRIALSGMVVAQAEDVEAAYTPYFENFAATSRDGWVCLTARRTAVNASGNR